jgi:hypothetical protein
VPSTVMFVTIVNTAYGKYSIVIISVCAYAILTPASIPFEFADLFSLYVSACTLVYPLIKIQINNGTAHPISPFALQINTYVVCSSFVI